MPHSAALPFLLKRGTQVFTASGMSTTSETVHGLLLLEEDRLKIQWRVGRKTDHLDSGIRTEEEVEPVRQITVRLEAVAGAALRSRWWDRLTGPRLVLTATDLSAFEELAGEGGLSLDHPAELVLRLRRSDRLAAEEFGAELAMAIAQRKIPRTPERTSLQGRQTGALPESGQSREVGISDEG